MHTRDPYRKGPLQTKVLYADKGPSQTMNFYRQGAPASKALTLYTYKEPHTDMQGASKDKSLCRQGFPT